MTHPLHILAEHYGGMHKIPLAALKGAADAIRDAVEDMDAWLAEVAPC